MLTRPFNSFVHNSHCLAQNHDSLDQWLNNPVEVKVDGSVPCRMERSLLIPRVPGVYLIHDLRGVLYVGRSEDLRRRFNEHYWRSSNQRIAAVLAHPIGNLQFSWHVVKFPEQVAVERSLIRYFKPPCNHQMFKNR